MVAVRFEGTGAEIAALPDEPARLRETASDAADAGDYERAAAAYTKLLQLGPSSMNQVIYLTSRGQARLEGRDYEAAIADFEAALRVVDYPAVRELLEEAHARKAAALRGRFDEAVAP
jgi:tetratricopeptide (TPR) repeat protein